MPWHLSPTLPAKPSLARRAHAAAKNRFVAPQGSQYTSKSNGLVVIIKDGCHVVRSDEPGIARRRRRSGRLSERACSSASPYHCDPSFPSQGSNTRYTRRLAAEEPNGERDYIDDDDNSNESLSATERTVEHCSSTSRSAGSLFRTTLRHAAGTSPGAPVPLFYTFCALLI
jgi:hypothetical protein